MKPGSGSVFKSIQVEETDAVPIPAGSFLADKDVTKLIYPFFCKEGGVFCSVESCSTRQKGNEERCASNLPT